MEMPETRYARSGDVAIAYQVLGDGPFDVVFAPGAVSHVELNWDAAGFAALLHGIAGHARLIVFDKRGTACPTGTSACRRWRREATTSGR